MGEPKEYHNLTLQHFQYFIMVSELGTMLAASEQMNVSQPLLSQKIAQLENALEIKLFTRHKRKLELTDAGKEFLQTCKTLVAQLDADIDDLYAKHHTEQSGVLRIGFSDGQESSSIYEIVRLLNAEIPGITVEVIIENRLTIIDKVLSGDIDFCCCADTERFVNNKNISYRKLFSLQFNCIVRASSQLAQRDLLEWKDLDDCISYWPTSLKNTAMTKDLLKFFKDHSLGLTLEYHDVDYFTLRKFLHDDKHVILTLTPEVDDPALKVCQLGGLSYPMILAWKKGESKELAKYVDKVLGAFKRAGR